MMIFALCMHWLADVLWELPFEDYAGFIQLLICEFPCHFGFMKLLMCNGQWRMLRITSWVYLVGLEQALLDYDNMPDLDAD